MKNVGGVDRLLRLILGIPLLVLLFAAESPWRWAGLLGFVFLFNAVSGTCLFNRLLGINTCRRTDKAG